MPAVEKSLPFYLIVGLLQALAFVVALEYDSAGLAVFAVVLGVNLQLLGSARPRIVVLAALLFALLLAAITAWVSRDLPEAPDSQRTLKALWAVSGHLVAYVGTAFILSWPPGPGRGPRYDDLFRHAWNNGFIVLLAGLVTGLFWALLLLCASLFQMIGIGILEDLFHDRYFNAVALTLVFSLGMRMGRENDKVIGMLRGILLSLCRFLTPLAALIVVLFSLTLLFTGLEPVWQTGRASTILLCLVAITVFLVNGVFQDGTQSRAYPRTLTLLVEASLVLLPLLTLLAGYSTWLRIEQYGLSPSRFGAALLVAIAACYSLAAVWAVLGRGDIWLARLKLSNPWLALLCCVLLIVIQTPWLNPQTVSARDQVQRLLDGRTPPDKFDADYLYRGLGLPGRQAFERLAGSLPESTAFDQPTRELLVSLLQEAREPYWSRKISPDLLEWVGTPVKDHEQFVSPRLGPGNCMNVRCVMWAVDLDGDGQEEVVQFSASWSPLYFYRRDAKGDWTLAGRMEGRAGGAQPVDAIRAGKVRVIQPRFRSLDVDGQIYAPIEEASEK